MPVGRLTQRIAPSGEVVYEFVYVESAMDHSEYPQLPGLPDLYREYESPSLFPVFSNRIMPRQRPDYVPFVEQLHLPPDADPFEVLGRSEGVRSTDRIEVFPDIETSSDGGLSTTFFVRGIRHLAGAADVAAELHEGLCLDVRPERDNPVNPLALLLDAQGDRTVGWIPDYLVDVFHDLKGRTGSWPAVRIEHVNPASTPPHMRVLCRMRARRPDGYRAFDGPAFQPLSSERSSIGSIVETVA